MIKAFATLIWLVVRALICLLIRPRTGREFTDTYLGTRPGAIFSDESAWGIGCYWACWLILTLVGLALFTLLGNYLVNHP